MGRPSSRSGTTSGVYLPISSTTPILAGGLVRWLVDLHLRKKHRNLSEEDLAAEGDKSPGVVMPSAYIAGGALAGIAIAILALPLAGFTERVTRFMESANPFFAGASADALSLIPFGILALLLYLAGRELILKGKRPTT